MKLNGLQHLLICHDISILSGNIYAAQDTGNILESNADIG